MNAGADVTARNKRGKTPLQLAMESSKKIPAVVNALKRASERELGRKAERRRLAKSCAKWNTEAFFEHAGAADVSRCLKTKNPNARNKQGETPLHKAAAYNKKPAVVTALLKAGAGVNARMYTEKRPCTRRRGTKTLRSSLALLKAGAEVNAKDKYGEDAPAQRGGSNKNPAVITALVKAGAEVNARDKDGDTPLHNAAMERKPRRHTTLVKAGAEVNARNKSNEYGGGKTPLHNAAWNENPAVITTLLKAGAEVNARTPKVKAGAEYGGGETPLHMAAWNKNPAVITALLKAGAEVNARTPKTNNRRRRNAPEHSGADQRNPRRHNGSPEGRG